MNIWMCTGTKQLPGITPHPFCLLLQLSLQCSYSSCDYCKQIKVFTRNWPNPGCMALNTELAKNIEWLREYRMQARLRLTLSSIIYRKYYRQLSGSSVVSLQNSCGSPQNCLLESVKSSFGSPQTEQQLRFST